MRRNENNRLTVKKIVIKEFENVKYFEKSFGPRLAVLPPDKAFAVRKALGVAFKDSMLAGPALKSDRASVITVKTEISGETYVMTATGTETPGKFIYTLLSGRNGSCEEYFRMIRQSEEEEEISCFFSDGRNRFSDKFKQYKDIENYYVEDRFFALTDGVGKTRTFRSCLDSHFREQNFECGLKKITVKEDGEITFVSSGVKLERDDISESDAVLYEYLSFLSVNKLWQRIEKIRDFNHVFLPLMIFDLCDRTDEATDLSDFVDKALELGRQVFVCGEKDRINERVTEKKEKEL